MTCPTTPQCAAFAQGFESGDVDNWAPTLQTAGPFARPAVVTGVAHSGSFALAVSIRNGNGRVVLARPLCTAGALAVIPSTRRISVWVRWEGPAFTANDVGTGCELGLLYQGADLPYGASDRVIRPIGSWQQIVSSIVGDASQADVDCYVNEPWTGTLYFDDFTIE
jgi:hypothetical protein